MSSSGFILKRTLFVFSFGAMVSVAVAQDKKAPPPTDKNKPATGMPVADSAMRKRPVGPTTGVKPYGEVITAAAVTQKGLITVHKVEDRWYFEIPDSLMKTDLLIENRLAKGAADAQSSMPPMGYAGDDINSDIITFERGPNNKLFMRSQSFTIIANDTTSAMYRAVTNSTVQPIILAFDVKAEGKNSVVIDMTDMLKGDEPTFGFSPNAKRLVKAGGLQADKSYIVSVKSFPLNTEIKTVKTYSRAQGGPIMPGEGGGGDAGGASTVTLELNCSIVMLPRKPMKPRYYDSRVGYFNTSYKDYDSDPQRVKTTTMAVRWRLEPKDEDIERAKRGELVEPKKPIVFYIDPATPKQWIPYLMQAVNDWQPAFEQAGFKNAIMAKLAPTPQEDSTWSIEDARNSVIVYKASDIPNASGPNVNDPRSGEIIESHINFYHNIQSLIHDWYMVQAGAIDPEARKMEFSDELMGTLIKLVVSHEVGHTLGLRHNWGASFNTPVEKMRDKEWLIKNGHTCSIMDYARFNYVAQPGDGVTREGIMPRINDYDKWAIEWGYKPIIGASADDEKAILNKWVVEKTKNPRLRFVSGEKKQLDPRAQSEDLGDNVMKANTYGIKNLQFVLKNLPSWVNKEGEDYSDLANMYNVVFSQYKRYVFHVVNFIGGVYADEKTSDQSGSVFQVAPKSMQKEAVAFINENVFKKPLWLYDKNIAEKISRPNTDNILSTTNGVLMQLFEISKLNNLTYNATSNPTEAYTLLEYFMDIKKGIWGELKGGQTIDPYRRVLQKTFVTQMGEYASLKNKTNSAFVNGGMDATKTDISSVCKGILSSLKSEITAAIPLQKDEMSRYHLKDVLDRINGYLKTGTGSTSDSGN